MVGRMDPSPPPLPPAPARALRFALPCPYPQRLLPLALPDALMRFGSCDDFVVTLPLPAPGAARLAAPPHCWVGDCGGCGVDWCSVVSWWVVVILMPRALALTPPHNPRLTAFPSPAPSPRTVRDQLPLPRACLILARFPLYHYLCPLPIACLIWCDPPLPIPTPPCLPADWCDCCCVIQ